MVFLEDLVAKIVEWFVATFVVEKVKDELKQKASDGALKESSQADAEALKKAQTSEERNAALKAIADHTFKSND